MKKSVISAAGSSEMSGASRWLAASVAWGAPGGIASAAASATMPSAPKARGSRMGSSLVRPLPQGERLEHALLVMRRLLSSEASTKPLERRMTPAGAGDRSGTRGREGLPPRVLPLDVRLHHVQRLHEVRAHGDRQEDEHQRRAPRLLRGGQSRRGEGPPDQGGAGPR